MTLQDNFFASIEGKTKEEVSYLFQKLGWQIHRPTFKGYKITNSWSELILDKDYEEGDLLLYGHLTNYPENIEVMESALNQLGSAYRFEIYDENNQIITEKTKSY